MKDLTWKVLWDSVKVNLQYPVRIYGYIASGVGLLLAFWQTQLGTVPSWVLWLNAALIWGGAKFTERKTGSIKYLTDNSDDSFKQDPDRITT